MIKTEIYSENLVRTYSDNGFKIQQNDTNIIYDEAIDPVSMNRTYTETNIPISEDEEVSEAEILNILLGGQQ